MSVEEFSLLIDRVVWWCFVMLGLVGLWIITEVVVFYYRRLKGE